MHRFFVPQLYNETMTIEGVDARHISKVLRMQPGVQLQLVSDDGVSALAEITAIDSECVTVHCLEKLAESHEPAVRLILAQGLAKGEKMEFIIQKAVEMGAYSVVPVAMEHSVVRLDGAKAVKKVERWQKIAESAAKQSKRDIIPKVQPVQTMAQMLAANDCATKIIAYDGQESVGEWERRFAPTGETVPSVDGYAAYASREEGGAEGGAGEGRADRSAADYRS